jgi:hypothetical protein
MKRESRLAGAGASKQATGAMDHRMDMLHYVDGGDPKERKSLARSWS